MDLGFLVAAREQNLLELDMFMNSTTLAQGSGLDTYWKAIAERLTQKETYALFDETGGRVFADAIKRGIFSLERPVRQRARQPSATAGFLAKLPNFRPANIEDVLGIRDELQGSLSRFRAAISALTREFEHDPTEWEFFDDVEAAWRDTVAPALEELQESSLEARFSRQLLVELLWPSAAVAVGGSGSGNHAQPRYIPPPRFHGGPRGWRGCRFGQGR